MAAGDRFSASGLFGVVTSWSRCARRIGSDGPDVARELPCLFGGQLVSIGGHPMRPSVPDRCEDRYRFRAVKPPAVEKGGADTALPLIVTFRASEPGVETLALTQGVGVRLIRLAQRKIDLWRSAADAIGHQGDLIERSSDRRVQTQLALLPLTT